MTVSSLVSILHICYYRLCARVPQGCVQPRAQPITGRADAGTDAPAMRNETAESMAFRCFGTHASGLLPRRAIHNHESLKSPTARSATEDGTHARNDS